MTYTCTCMTSQTAWLAGIRHFSLASVFGPAAQSRSAEHHQPCQIFPVPRPFITLGWWCSGAVAILSTGSVAGAVTTAAS